VHGSGRELLRSVLERLVEQNRLKCKTWAKRRGAALQMMNVLCVCVCAVQTLGNSFCEILRKEGTWKDVSLDRLMFFAIAECYTVGVGRHIGRQDVKIEEENDENL